MPDVGAETIVLELVIVLRTSVVREGALCGIVKIGSEGFNVLNMVTRLRGFVYETRLAGIGSVSIILPD
jgi:hypothetical protein